jgi:3-dehydroquinate dehydratase type I
MICISISEVSQLDSVIKEGAELIELRLDLIRVSPKELYARVPAEVKTVVTCREGEYRDQTRIELLNEAIKLGASYVDLELESEVSYSDLVMKVAEKQGCQVIFSHHDFKATPSPDALKSLLLACYDRGGAVAKIATLVQSEEDVLKLFSIYSLPGRKVILGMGHAGRITRVAAPLLGSEFTFASPAEGKKTAPGQMSVKQLKTIYNIISGS